MTSYRLQQDFFSLSTSLVIADSEGRDRFKAQGKWLSTGVTFTDLHNGDVLELVQRVFGLFVSWEVKRGGDTVAHLERAGFLTNSFTVDVPGPNDFTIRQHGMLRLDAVVSRTEDGDVARLYHPEWLSGDLAIDIEPGQDDALIVALAAILVVLRRQG